MLLFRLKLFEYNFYLLIVFDVNIQVTSSRIAIQLFDVNIYKESRIAFTGILFKFFYRDDWTFRGLHVLLVLMLVVIFVELCGCIWIHIFKYELW